MTFTERAGSRGSDAAVSVAVLRLAIDAGRRVCVGLGLLASKRGAFPYAEVGRREWVSAVLTGLGSAYLLRPPVAEASALRDGMKGAPVFVIPCCRCCHHGRTAA